MSSKSTEKIAAVISREVKTLAEREGTWAEDYEVRLQDLAEAAALVAAASVIAPGEPVECGDILAARVANLKAAGLVRTASHVRSAMETVYRLALQTALAVL